MPIRALSVSPPRPALPPPPVPGRRLAPVEQETGAEGPDAVSLSEEAQRYRTRVGPPGPRLGDEGERVLALQEDLLRWMPGWKGHLEADGIYGPRTRRAVEFFKKVHGTGRDGRRLDPRTAELLAEVRTGGYWARDPQGRARHPRRAELESRYQRALRSGYPLADGRQGLSPAEIRDLAARAPDQLVRYRGHEARALTWKRYLELEKAVAREFPGHHLAVTCTTGGQHSSLAHPEGRAVDFVLERDRDGYRPDVGEFDSSRLAELTRENGFEPFDEYRHDSTWRTGPHMHAEAV